MILFANLLLAASMVAPPIPGSWSTTITNPSQCNDTHISVPSIPSTARWVQVEIASTNHWWTGVEGLYASSAWGYLSWDYNAHGRAPYASEIGTQGDGYNDYTVYHGTLGNVDLHTQRVYCDTEECLNDNGVPPVGPYDGTDDFGGTSGGDCEDSKSARDTGAACYNSTVLAGLKAGSGLELHHIVNMYCCWATNSHCGFSPDNRSVTVTVTWGS